MLLDEIKTERGEVPFELKEDFKKAKQEFLDNTDIDVEGTKLIKLLYRELDKYLKLYLEDNEITCHKGCGHCCKQLICCTTIEMELIVNYINLRPKTIRKNIKKCLKKDATKFMLWFGKHLFDIPEDQHQLISEPIRTKYFGKPCPFLKNEICQIYPARPSICRTTKVKGDFCGKHVQLGQSRESKPIKLFYDQVVMELIKEEEKRINKEIKVLPVMVWPLTKTFKKEFFS